ncbi:MAG: hypothetical protein HUU20_03505 [Pirellulales bacterium]|nr:hypothetical protein [Pirellulales bacterium]
MKCIVSTAPGVRRSAEAEDSVGWRSQAAVTAWEDRPTGAFSSVGRLLVFAALVAAAGRAHADDLAAAKAIFADPPREFASAPLWVWNDLLTEEQIRGTLRDLAGQKVKQAFVHPRPGLMTPYLSDDWFRLWQAALDEAERLDMNIWIYDENSYPSGFAGGFVPAEMPESQGRSLTLREEKRPGKPGDDVVAVFRLDKDGYENVTEAARAGGLPEGRYLVAAVLRSESSPWYGGKTYVDLLYPGVTQKFLEVTLEPYRQRLGDQFGKRIPGSFTDEPRLEGRGGVPWTVDLAEQFQNRWGYSLIDHLPSLTRPLGDWRRVRHNFLQLLLDLFIERWGKPYYEYCAKNGLEFTGHYWEHEWPNCTIVPDNMAMYAWHQRPAIDCLMNQYREDTHAQFGNVRAVKELSSAANQLGLNRTLCEAYGAGGWDLRFEDMKRIGDWLYVLGVNTLDEHLSYITLRGARKHDHPLSFSYHEPWWDSYHVMAQYFTRLAAALSQGEQVNKVLLLEPTTTAWMYQYDSSQAERLKTLGDRFQELVLSLERAQAEYDIGCEDILARHGSVESSTLVVGRRRYETVVLPLLAENLNAKTAGLLEKYVAAGGRVLCCGAPPALIDAQASDRIEKAARAAGWKKVEPAAVPELVCGLDAKEFAIRRAEGDAGILLHHRRQLADGQLLFLVNTSIDSPSSGLLETAAGSVEQWDPATGRIGPYPFEIGDGRARVRFELAPCGSLLLCFRKKPAKPAAAAVETASAIQPQGDLQIRRLGPNVLVIDYVDITAGGKTRKNLHFYKAAQMAFAANGMERNPWDSAVQFRDELISRKFPPESGFEATWRFTIEGAVPQPLEAVIERPDLYTITCNGKPVTAKPGEWWLDKAFGRIDIASAAKVGENEVAVKAAPFTIFHELEPAYILGSFSLKPAQSGFAIVPEQPLALGAWNAQGHPLYATGVSYIQTFEAAVHGGRVRVRLPAWQGSVAKVSVNGEPAGHIYHQPWQCDVTAAVRPGKNTVEVAVIGTLKNTLGPHHSGQLRGAAWPAMFRQGPETGPPPGEKYDTIGYGLFEPFEVEVVTVK